MNFWGIGNGDVMIHLTNDEARELLDGHPLLGLPGRGDQERELRLAMQTGLREPLIHGESLAAVTSSPARCSFESTIEQPSGTIRITATVEIG
jgi:hypothetical protein